MPQMNPMNWNLILIFNFMNMLLFISYFYFKIYLTPCITNKKMLFSNKFNLTW